MASERVVERLNAALHELFATDERVYLLGEDVLDPYGGAFKATRGLSTAYPGRVLATPLSENGMVGVANGLAMTGTPVIVEIMFGDFIGLAFDQLVNFATKSVSMYGRRVAMPLLVRCPVGGNRGYGPTHSQSPQKHFIGVPHLTLYELSAFHSALDLIRTAFQRAEPCILFEDKVLYTERVRTEGVVDDEYRYEPIAGPGEWVRVFRPGTEPAAVVLLAPGGMATRALNAVRQAHRSGLVVDLLVPAQLYPFEARPILPMLAAAGRVCVVEESVRGGTWGSELAAELQGRLWSELLAPIEIVSSRLSVIPAAPHLERTVLVQPDDVLAALLRLAGYDGSTGRVRPEDPAVSPAVPVEAGWPVCLPKLNTNDETAILLEQLVDHGAAVTAGTPVALIETSKAVDEIEAGRDGVLQWVRHAGDECRFGEVIAYINGPDAAAVSEPGGKVVSPPQQVAMRTGSAVVGDGPRRAEPGAAAGPAGVAAGPAGVAARPAGTDAGPAGAPLNGVGAASPADRVQAAVAATVTRSLGIPAAFAVGKVDLDPALDFLDRLGADSGAAVDMPAFFVAVLGRLRHRYPQLYGTRGEDGVFHPAAAADVAVTVDTGTGLFMPVVRGADVRDLGEVADDLMEFRMAALDGGFSGAQLAGAAISLSVNTTDGVVLVQPLIMAPQVCVVSIAGVDRELRLAQDGSANEVRVMSVGVAYDHRLVNGRTATQFLAALRDLVAHPERLANAGEGIDG